MEILGGGLSAQALDASHVWSFRIDHCTMRKRHEYQHRPWTPVTCGQSAVITVRWGRGMRINTGPGRQSRVITPRWSLCDEEEARGSAQALDASHVWSFRGDHCTMRRGTRISTDPGDESRVITPRWSLFDQEAQGSIPTYMPWSSHAWSFCSDHSAIKTQWGSALGIECYVWSLCSDHSAISTETIRTALRYLQLLNSALDMPTYCSLSGQPTSENDFEIWDAVGCDVKAVPSTEFLIRNVNSL